jgi:ubiquinone/menaquinone biosynthesis C-methylase UbiE
MSSARGQRALVVKQFTEQAEAFATAPAIANAEALRLLVGLSGAGPQDTALDVACGPGLVVCAFAEVVRAATGIDLTPAMIDRARAVQREKALRNVSWQVGDVLPLPFSTASFSIVTCRYAFHHFEQPSAVLAEMKRVCQPGGRIVLADVHTSAHPEEAAAFNRMERLRDPSHVRALPLAELESLLRQAGLELIRQASYSLEFEVEALLQGSLPNPGQADKVRRMFVEELLRPRMGLGTRRVGSAIHFAYPIVVLVAERPT